MKFILVSASPARHCIPSSICPWVRPHWGMQKTSRDFSCLEKARGQANKYSKIVHLVCLTKCVVGTKRGCRSRALIFRRGRGRKPPAEAESFPGATTFTHAPCLICCTHSIHRHFHVCLYLYICIWIYIYMCISCCMYAYLNTDLYLYPCLYISSHVHIYFYLDVDLFGHRARRNRLKG